VRIEWFKAKGFRSLRDVEIDWFGPFNVFYGKNGAGKSNLLAAMRVFFALLAQRTGPGRSFEKPGEPEGVEAGVIQLRDRCQLERSPEMVLGATLRWMEAPRMRPPKELKTQTVTAEITYDWDRKMVRISRLEFEFMDLLTMQVVARLADKGAPWIQARTREAELRGVSFDATESFLKDHLGLPVTELANYRWHLRDFLHEVAQSAFVLIDADRAPRSEQVGRGGTSTRNVAELLSDGKLKEALLRASRHTDAGIRKRYKQLGALLEGPPFHRPPFEMTEDPESGRVELVETVSDPLHEARDIPLDLVGLGLAQVYYILARALLGNTRAAAIEEPEAHLHAPSTGMQLRQVLERLVNEGYLDQLFIATHSNLFDLDRDGYFDVSFDRERGTQVTRKGLDSIDKDHLYEPGPAKHILQRLLRRMDENTVLFRKPDGAPVTIREMLDMLQRDDPLAKEFLDDVHGAAIHAVRLKDKQSVPASGEPVK
jgi:predicted ATPase